MKIYIAGKISFQFHGGTIDSQFVGLAVYFFQLFQFHDGTIDRVFEYAN